MWDVALITQMSGYKRKIRMNQVMGTAANADISQPSIEVTPTWENKT